MAGALGVVLLLALAITLFAQVERVEVPRWGATAERAWDGDVRAALAATASDPSASTSVPMTTRPQTIDVPLLGTLRPLPSSGSVAFQPACGAVTIAHALASQPLATDLNAAPLGCITFDAQTAYGAPFSYSLEMGGLVRSQGGSSVVVAGPALQLNVTSPTSERVALTIPALRGGAISTSSGNDVRLVLSPSTNAAASLGVPGADRWTLAFDTPHPAAWKAWFSDAFTNARFAPADASAACVPVDCSLSGGFGRVSVSVNGPIANGADLSLSMAYDAYDVAIR